MKKQNISILLSTHKRTDAFSNSVFSLIDLAHDTSTLEFIIGVDNNDTIGQNHFETVIRPVLEEKGISFKAIHFEPLGYLGLNRYYNTLAKHANGNWLFVWCDDAIMETKNWDKVIGDCTGEFKLLKVHTHNEHPYSIFPIVPCEWYELMGYLSRHQLIDTELSSIAYMLDIMKIIEVDVTHDRSDLTGNNADENANKKHYLEGNPQNPQDFYHISFQSARFIDTDKICAYMKERGLDTSWWENTKLGKQDPWVKLRENDINGQTGPLRVQ